MARTKNKIEATPSEVDATLELINTSNLPTEIWPIDKAASAKWQNNPRAIKDSELKHLRTSLKEFGFVVPLIYNKRTETLIGGHQRLKAAQLENFTEVPVIILDLSYSKATALAIALNKIEGKWDYELLEKALFEISESDNLALTGFNETELISLFATVVEPSNDVEFDDFVSRQVERKAQQFMYFRSPKVSFTCTKESYDALITRLYAEVGLNDLEAKHLFYKRIGLDD